MAQKKGLYQVHALAGKGDQMRAIKLVGRAAWALRALIDAGGGGVTPIERPAPRWSSYIHKLRWQYGIAVETSRESHGGKFAGTHARYVLRSPVELVEPDQDQGDIDALPPYASSAASGVAALSQGGPRNV